LNHTVLHLLDENKIGQSESQLKAGVDQDLKVTMKAKTAIGETDSNSDAPVEATGSESKSDEPMSPVGGSESKSRWTTSNILLAGGITVMTVSTIPFAMGFTAGGILAGSTAAAIQSSIGNVAAGSVFAMTQSLAATGTFTNIFGGGAALTVSSYFARKLESDNDKEGSKEAK
jgi:hypothetical protein